MGILNCTPDSFSDGGRLATVAAAVAAGQAMVAAGAVWLDIGGESSRPGADPVDAEEELSRVVPVVAALRAAGVAVPLSIDTVKATVARAALAAGASAINDISAGLADPQLFAVAAEYDCPLILMHMRGTPRTMQQAPVYADVVGEITAFLAERAAAAEAAGVRRERLLADPGIGFGKSVAHNLDLLRALPQIRAALGLELVVGISRKRFLAALAGSGYPASDQLGHAIHALIAPWCALLRVHDVPGTMHALRAATA
jgi:dihydropteroate synthase